MPRILVISDLHISAGALDDCDRELEEALVRFLAYASSVGDDRELVINGDFLDFVQAPPAEGRALEDEAVDPHTTRKEPVCFTERQSLVKLRAMVAAHSPIFNALGGFLRARTGNRITLLPGNHDPDFFWPLVRREFAEAVSGGNVTVHLERAYHPAACPEVHIEHGQQFDPINGFYIDGKERWSEANPPILPCGEEPRLYECLGTRFLIRYLNSLDAKYPFVDNVKPFGRFLKLFGASALHPEFGAMQAGLALFAMLRFLGKMSVTRPKDLLGIEAVKDEARPALIEKLKAMRRTRPGPFKQLSNSWPGDRNLGVLLDDAAWHERILEWCAENAQLFDAGQERDAGTYLSAGGGGGNYLSLGVGFSVDESAQLINGAAGILKNPAVKLVVMGHTHDPQRRPGGLNYFNTGCWTRYYRFGGDNDAKPWSILTKESNHSYVRFPYELNYMEIDPRDAAAAEMKCFAMKDHD